MMMLPRWYYFENDDAHTVVLYRRYYCGGILLIQWYYIVSATLYYFNGRTISRRWDHSITIRSMKLILGDILLRRQWNYYNFSIISTIIELYGPWFITIPGTYPMIQREFPDDNITHWKCVSTNMIVHSKGDIATSKGVTPMKIMILLWHQWHCYNVIIITRVLLRRQ